jgi:mono/diheme cytochrome c family protein
MKQMQLPLPISAKPGRHRRARNWALGLALLLGLVTSLGCAQGSYPLDIFYEMHYQPSYRASEPPRLSAPASAVPMYPAAQATSFTLDGQHLFEVNCSMCHGITGKGDGPVLQKMMNIYGYQPVVTPDLTSDLVQGMGAAGMEGFMRSGLVVMPNFSKLLNDEEMAAIATYVQTLP